MLLNFKKSDIYLAIKWASAFKAVGFFKNFFFIVLVAISPLVFYGLFSQRFSQKIVELLLGLLIIFLVLFLTCLIKQSFFNWLKKPEIKIPLTELVRNPEKYNLADFLSFEAARAIDKSIKAIPKSKTTASHLFYFLLKDNPKLNFIFSRALLNLKEIKELLKLNLKNLSFSSLPSPGSVSPSGETEPGLGNFSQDFQDTILEALKIAQKKNRQRIEIGDILVALANCEPVFKRILVDHNLKIEDIENLVWWLEDIEERRRKKKRFWEYDNLAKRGTLAKEWTAAYTVNLDRYSKDLTALVRKTKPEVIGHSEEIKTMERILARLENNNVLIVGQPGTGRKSMIYALAQKSLLGKSLPEVNYKRVVEIDMPSLLTRAESIDEAEVILDKIFNEATSAGNIILIIDKFHNYIGQPLRPGIIDISGIIASYLRMPQFQLVAITSYDGLHRFIERNPSILSLFEKVEVSEISQRETYLILEKLVPVLERKYKKMISYPALKNIVSLTERYMPSSAFPEKAIKILDEVTIYVASATSDKVVLPKHVAKVITQKTEIPVGEIETKEKRILLNLEDLIHQRIINQEEAVKEVSTAMRRARAEITIRNGPIGAFLFLGPTGVGKTETSKALAEIYFGAEDRMIRLDMSEFQNTRDIPRLIGSFNEKGLLTTQVRENPFSLILFDEIEKAHKDILNLFLQVLDEGHLTDGLGRKVNFKNTVIICTSNAGYKIILEALEQKTDWQKVRKKLLNYLFAQAIFRPEFINRFDAFVVFRPLSKENLLDIAELMLKKLKINLKNKGIEFVITDELKEKIVELGYNPTFGAREMRRVIQEKVENVLAESLLKNEIKRGDKVEMNEKFELIIKTRNLI